MQAESLGGINMWLMLAAALSLIGAALHVAIIFVGPDWYRAFGAGEAMAQAAARGSAVPAVITMGIASILLAWAALALSAAGVIPRLPLLPWALVAVVAILMARGLLIFVPDWWRPDLSASFKFWSSAFVLAMALSFAVGTVQRWKYL